MLSPAFSGAQSSLDFYIEQAMTRNASLQNFKLQGELSTLETEKINTQHNNPQWAFTGDYLLAPYFFNKGRVVLLEKAFGLFLDHFFLLSYQVIMLGF